MPEIYHKRLLVFVLLLACCGLWRLAVRSNSALAESETGQTAAKQSYDEKRKAKDYIELNGAIFEDWPQPVAAIMFSGELDGYLEPCGCAGLENQLGGLKRRGTLIKQLQAKGWPLAEFDMGGLTKRLGHQAEIKYRYELDALVQLGYSAVGIGEPELKLTTDELVYAIANLPPEKNPILSANVGLYSFDSGLTRTYRVATAGGKRIGVTSVLGAKYKKSLANVGDVVYRSPAEGLAEVAPLLAAKHCEYQVLMVYGTPEEARELARKFPQFNLVAATGGAEVPPNRPDKIEGSPALLIETGHKGMYVVVLGIYDDPQQPIRYQRVPLDGRFDDSPAMQQLLTKYQEELKLQGLSGLGLSGSAHPEGKFIGSAACADCHFSATEVFEQTPHAHATQSIIDLDPPRIHDPECLSCHVTGWNPQQYFPYASGFMGMEKTPQLVGNGCENCHGPAAAHVAAELGESDVNEAEQEALRRALRLKIVENEGNKGDQIHGAVVENCMRCHDLDNSPDFDFQKYWPKVKHEGKD